MNAVARNQGRRTDGRQYMRTPLNGDKIMRKLLLPVHHSNNNQTKVVLDWQMRRAKIRRRMADQTEGEHAVRRKRKRTVCFNNKTKQNERAIAFEGEESSLKILR